MTEPVQSSLIEAAALLARAWSQRSPGERSAFADRLAATSAPRDLPDDQLRTVRERAALSGAVAPADLVRGLDRDSGARALDLLAVEFDRVQTAGRWSWMLRAESRRDTLAHLRASGRVRTVLNEVASIPTDRAGRALRFLARTGSVPRTPPATAVQALAWAQPLGGLAGDLAEAQRQAGLASLQAGYDVLTWRGVFGRDTELARLRAFAEETPDPGQPVPLLVMTGIGGAGKSTVLGRFIQPYLGRIAAGDPAAPAVVVIDFDRVLFRPSAELELSLELTRQLGWAAPVAAADFAALRYQTRTEQQQAGSDTFQGVAPESATRTASGLETEMGVLVRLHELDLRPVILVLDTFEEWQRERPDPPSMTWNDPEARILDWISRVRYGMGLAGLRVVVSGRAGLPGQGRPPLTIGDLRAEAARALLRSAGVRSRDTAAVVRLVGRNPLTLHVAARFYRGLADGPRHEFLAGSSLSSGVLTEELRQAVLYGRFLEHITDDQVRKLAHPGLVLRRVTPDLVQYVLAERCGLGVIDPATAERLVARLAAEVWLVTETPDGLHHRTDVRRAMLTLMSGDPAYAEVTRQIHHAAVRWYREGRDRALFGTAAEAEALYHSLMLETGGEPALDYLWTDASGPGSRPWRRLAQILGQAVNELPAKVAAQVRVLRGDEIPEQDALTLPGLAWQQWIADRGSALLNNGEAAAALSLWESRQANQPVRTEPPWLARAYCDTARWGGYWPAVRRFGLSAPHTELGLLRSGRYPALDALLSAEPGDLRAYVDVLMRYFSVADAGGHPPSAVFERLFLDLFFSFGVPESGLSVTSGMRWIAPQLAGTLLAGTERRGLDQPLVDLYPVDQLRRVLVWIAAPAGTESFVIERVATVCHPDPRWMRDFARFAGVERDDVDAYIQHREELAQAAASSRQRGLRTDELLGEWSASYARALGGDPVRLRRSGLREAAEWIHVLRGDNPELRPAILRALVDTAARRGGLRELGEIAQRLVPVPAMDLSQADLPARGGEAGRRPLIQLVEYVDRSGVMAEFLTEAEAAWPESEPIREVVAAFRGWDSAYRQLLDELARQLLDA